MRYHIPDWARPTFDARLYEHIRSINQLSDVSAARLQLVQMQGKLQEAIPPELTSLLLEYETIINERNSLEQEYLYWIDIRDGLLLSEEYRKCIANQQ